MKRLVFVCHDPWLATCLATARPDVPVVTFGDDDVADRLETIAQQVLVVPRDGDMSTRTLLADPEVERFVERRPSTLLSFKPGKRVLEAARALGADYALPDPTLSAGLENKLALPGIAEGAGVRIPRQQRVKLEGSFADVAPDLARPLVVQSPRSNAGRRTWRVEDEAGWAALLAELGGRPAKAAEYIEGPPGTIGVVVDARGACVVTAPIVQVTGVPWLTPYRLGSCGNDFTWRIERDPGDGAYALGEALGAELARRGYRGHFGVDFVVGPDGPVLIEINPRLTASFALYASWRPRLLQAHLDAVAGRHLEAERLPPMLGGQLIVTNPLDDTIDAIEGDGLPPGDITTDTVWPSLAPVGPGMRWGRWVSRGVVVTAEGDLNTSWRPGQASAL